MQPHPHFRSQCDFTYLFCCKCTYDSHCVYKAFYVLDALQFGSWGIQIFFFVGGTYGLLGLIGIPFAILFFLLCGLSIRNLCKLNTDLQNKEIQQRSDMYQKWRWGGIAALGVGGIILAIVYYYAVKNSYEKAGYPSDEARGYGTSRLVNTLFSYAISIAILLGYRPSLVDSTKLLTMSAGGATLGAMQMQHGRPFELQQPVYAQQPQFVPFGGQGRMIGGPAQPMYMPSPDQGYNPPPPIVPLQMNTASAPAPYRPPSTPVNAPPQAPPTGPAGPRGEGTKPFPR